MKQKNYVLGFLFDKKDAERVVLIKKDRGPSFNIGKLNGVGGKIEPHEVPIEAMIREFKEEAGIDIIDWKYFLKLKHIWEDKTEANIWVFKAFSEEGSEAAYTAESEEIGSYWLEDVLDEFNTMVHNLNWIIPLALDKEQTSGEIVLESSN